MSGASGVGGLGLSGPELHALRSRVPLAVYHLDEAGGVVTRWHRAGVAAREGLVAALDMRVVHSDAADADLAYTKPCGRLGDGVVA